MRKLVTIFVLTGLVAALGSAVPAVAGKKKPITGSFTASGIPYPVDNDVNQRGCEDGIEGVHKTTMPFQAPAPGTLTVTMTKFQLDWDLWVTDPDRNVLGYSDQPIATPNELVTLQMAAKEKVLIAACNFTGEPQAVVDYKFTFR